MSIKVSDIPDDEWNSLREDYQDELSCIDYVDEDEYLIMLSISQKFRRS